MKKTPETEFLEQRGITYPVLCHAAAVAEMDAPAPRATTNTACVIPVAAVDALAWCAGKFQDIDLITRSPLVPEGVFIVNLPSRASYREILEHIKYWHQRGAVFLIARTGVPVVDEHMQENGCLHALKEIWKVPGEPDRVQFRCLAPPEVFARWVAKWSSPLDKRPADAKRGPVL